jgi:dihydrofolate reductase
MRKLIVSMNLTLDGFMAGPACELDWHFRCWTPDMADALCYRLSTADTILLGGTTYRAMAHYWMAKAAQINFPREDAAFAQMINTYAKVVVTSGPLTTPWGSTMVMKGNLARNIRQLKNSTGKHIVVYGSGKLVEALQTLDLVDEWHLWMHPVAIGKGKPLFKKPMARLQLLHTEMFSAGVVLLEYRGKETDAENDLKTILQEPTPLPKALP